MLEKMLALQNKRKKEGGFTLVELIVVLVILAILAALLIPALTGYIDKAKQKSITAETRQVVMAAQTLYDEAYGELKLNDANNIVFAKTAQTDKKTILFSEVASLAEVPEANIDTITVKTDAGTNKDRIATVVYKSQGKTCTYTASDGQYKFN